MGGARRPRRKRVLRGRRLADRTRTGHNRARVGVGHRCTGWARQRLPARTTGRKLNWQGDLGAQPDRRHRRARIGHSRPAATVPRARAQGRRVRAHPRDPRPKADRRRTGDVFGDVERALQLQVLQGAPALLRRDHHREDADGDVGGHRRERGRRRHRRRLGGHLQGRVAQPPVICEPYRARPPASAGSSATSWPWARVRSR